MHVKPLQDRVLVKRLEREATSPGGILIPDTAQEKPQEARVIAVGPGKTLDNGQVRKPVVQAGQKVLFGKYAGSEVKIDGIEHILLREDDLLAIIE